MLKAIGFSTVITLAVMILTAARSQETATEDLEGVLQQNAFSNVNEEHPHSSVIETGLRYDEETAGYEDQTTETTTMTDVLEASIESNDSLTEVFLRESEELLNLQSPTHQTSKLYPDIEDSPTLPTLYASPIYAEGVSPLLPPPISSPFSAMPELSQSLYPAYGASPLFPFSVPTFERNQTSLTGNQTNSPIGSLWQLLNHSQKANATAGGAGSGSVQNNSATAEGKGTANVGFGGFGIGLGIGGAIQTPLGNLAFGQGNGIALG